MPASLCKGVVRGRSVILDRGASLPEGTRVVVTPVETERGSPGGIGGEPKLAHYPILNEERRRTKRCT
jgi:hypothetical protein